MCQWKINSIHWVEWLSSLCFYSKFSYLVGDTTAGLLTRVICLAGKKKHQEKVVVMKKNYTDILYLKGLLKTSTIKRCGLWPPFCLFSTTLITRFSSTLVFTELYTVNVTDHKTKYYLKIVCLCRTSFFISPQVPEIFFSYWYTKSYCILLNCWLSILNSLPFTDMLIHFKPIHLLLGNSYYYIAMK